jgi:hypothetical protein
LLGAQRCAATANDLVAVPPSQKVRNGNLLGEVDAHLVEVQMYLRRTTLWTSLFVAVLFAGVPHAHAQTYTGAFETVGQWGLGTSCVYQFRRSFTDVTLVLGVTTGTLSAQHQSTIGPLAPNQPAFCPNTISSSQITSYGIGFTVVRGDTSATFTSVGSTFTIIEGTASGVVAAGTYHESSFGLFSDAEFTLTSGPIECDYDVEPESGSFPIAGGSGTISLTTQTGCIWSARSNSEWITVAPSSISGIGTGSIPYTVAENPDVARTGTITVAGTTVLVTQAGEEDEGEEGEEEEPETIRIVVPPHEVLTVGKSFVNFCLGVEDGSADEWSIAFSPVPGVQAYTTVDEQQLCLGGIPEQNGEFSFPVSVTDDAGHSDSTTVQLTIFPASDPEKQKWAKYANALLAHALYEAPEWLPEEYQQGGWDQAIAAALGWWFSRLAADPPRFDYTEIAEPIPFRLPDISSDGLPPAIASTLSTLRATSANAVGMAKALLISIERQQGAEISGDMPWQLRQEQAISTYSVLLADLLSERTRLLRLMAQLTVDDTSLPIVSQQSIRETKQLLQANPASLLQRLEFGGLSHDDAESIVQLLLVAGGPLTVPQPVFAVLAEQASALVAELVSLRPFGVFDTDWAPSTNYGIRVSVTMKIEAVRAALRRKNYSAVCGAATAIRNELQAVLQVHLAPEVIESLETSLSAATPFCAVP